MEEKVLCPKCKKGYIKIIKVCKLRWKVYCLECSYKQTMYYPQLMGFIRSLTYG